MLVPPIFARATSLREGAAGEAWLTSLPGLVDELLAAWACTPDGDLLHGGVGLVVPVTSSHGPAVIKISFPHASNHNEAHALRLLDGAGAVRLYAHDVDRWAMLLERADGPGPELVLDPDESVELMGDLAARVAVPTGSEITTHLADTASGWRDQVDERFKQAPTGTVSTVSLARAREAIMLAAADTTTTLLHGDLHEGNLLGAAREPWLMIDFKGWAGTAAFDAYTVALTRHGELRHAANPTDLVRDRIRRFAVAAHVDPDLARELAHARAVSSLLYETVTEATTFGSRLLQELIESPL